MIKELRISTFIVVFSLLAVLSVWAQKKNTFAPVNTAVPSLSIAPDARGGGMGDNGASTTPDINSQYWNPAKYAFMYCFHCRRPIISYTMIPTVNWLSGRLWNKWNSTCSRAGLGDAVNSNR